MKIIIPMAGRGSRFKQVVDQNPAYQVPKPLIQVKGKPMVWWALKSLPFVDLPDRPANTDYKVSPNDLTFIALQEHEDLYQVTGILKATFSPKVNVILIPEVTRGAAETALQAEKLIDSKDDLLITDSDNFFDGQPLYQAITHRTKNTVGIIPVFRPPTDEPKWSYTLFDKNHLALAVGEKDQVLAAKGAYSNIGAYYFSKASTFFVLAHDMVENQQMFGEQQKKEFYIAPLYQTMIKQCLRVKVAVVPEMWGLGTPKDLERFLVHYSGKS